MVDNDPFASIIDECYCSSSQEEFLRSSKFAREDEIFDENSPEFVNSGKNPPEFVAGGRKRVELDDWDGEKDLGFETKKSRVSGLELKGEEFRGLVKCSEKLVRDSEDRNKLVKKSRVSGLESKGEEFRGLVKCSEKLVRGSEDRNKQIVVYSGGLKFEMVWPLRWVGPAGENPNDGSNCCEKGVVNPNDGSKCSEMGDENPNNHDNELPGETCFVENPNDGLKCSGKGDMIGEGGGNGKGVENPDDGLKCSEKGDLVGKGDGNGEGAENVNDGLKCSGKIKNRGKRMLPRSVVGVGQIWGLSVDESDEMRNGVLRTRSEENVGRIVVGDEGRKSKSDHCGAHKDGSVNEVKNHGNRLLPSSVIREVQGTENGGNGTQNKQQDGRNVAGKRGKRSKTEDESLRRLVDVLKMLAARNPSDDYEGEVDIIETALRKGMTFPRNRYLVNSEKDK